MIELNGTVTPILRTTERHPGQMANGREKARTEKTSEAAPSRVQANGKSRAGVINFEYVPSGRLHLNQEERQLLIDFFQ